MFISPENSFPVHIDGAVEAPLLFPDMPAFSIEPRSVELVSSASCLESQIPSRLLWNIFSLLQILKLTEYTIRTAGRISVVGARKLATGLGTVLKSSVFGASRWATCPSTAMLIDLVWLYVETRGEVCSGTAAFSPCSSFPSFLYPCLCLYKKTGPCAWGSRLRAVLVVRHACLSLRFCLIPIHH